jgi:putative transcription factor
VRRRGGFDVSEDVELAEGLAQVVRQARERAGLTHEELGKRINERVSVLQRVETGKFQPDNALARKLEHALGVKILVSASVSVVTDQSVTKQPIEPTLGDVVSIKKRKSGGSG